MIFEFERDFAGTMRCIPMAVRFNLDLCGIKLSLKQWSRFGREKRTGLAHELCVTDEQIHTYRNKLVAFIEALPGQKVTYLEDKLELPWDDVRQVPSQILSFAASSNIHGIEWRMWSRLTRLQRFAIYKLTRSSHDNNNFAPALREFGLMS